MAVYGYTKNYKLIKPQFDTDTWHDYEYDNLDTIDAVLSAIFASGDWQGFWKTNTHYDAGGVVIDRDTDTMYKVLVEHTTTENTFALEQAAHPTYYELWSPNDLAESWAIKMDGKVSYTDFSSKAHAISEGLTPDGSSKEWAISATVIGDTGEYSSKYYATLSRDTYDAIVTNPDVINVSANIEDIKDVSSVSREVKIVADNIDQLERVRFGLRKIEFSASDWTLLGSLYQIVYGASNIIVAVYKNRGDGESDLVTNINIRSIPDNIVMFSQEAFDGYVLVADTAEISTYIHNQDTPSDVWVINHNLHRYPEVICVDDNGVEFEKKTVYNNSDQCVCYMNNMLSGKAYLN